MQNNIIMTALQSNEVIGMPVLSVTSRGQVTLRKEILRHLGLKPGDKLHIDLLPDGCGLIKVAPPGGDIRNFIGFLAHEGRPAVSIEEMNRSIEEGWAGKSK
jgi:bifunctional DNA-binding transcriptional regulator/antitoxin component of YhaV-PrlF toxin-antitoxin module